MGHIQAHQLAYKVKQPKIFSFLFKEDHEDWPKVSVVFMKIYSFLCNAHIVLLNEYSFSTEDPGYDDGLKSFLKVNMSAGKQNDNSKLIFIRI